MPGGTSIVVQVRGWQTTVGSNTYTTWAQAEADINAAIGNSGLFNITLATPPATPVNLVGLTGFDMVPFIPEPSSFALAGLGVAALLIFRRRK